ncbi:ABC transporter substrate-binding protein [Rhodoferax ferrireducens]|uniref:ABC transporter substrate-binding protein n=1 Tax=Rhodoferax ferrireducens TaxID=192843 RepID=UPI000E0D1E17|nr:ABC transporter substrate-binding protein [Rhodoferax ferrireducens]
MMKHGLRLFLALTVLLCAGITAGATPEPVVIGQSLPLTGAGFSVANRVLAGAKAHVARVNASGGILGRPVELVTLDDGGDPKRVAANVRTLVRLHKATVIVNCLGEPACLAAAETTAELRVPLVGPMSGALALRSREVRHVFSLRPEDDREADALARQLHAIGISRVVLLADEAEPARTLALAAALRRAGMQITRLKAEAQPASIEAAFRGIAQAASQALVLSLGNEVLETLARLPVAAREGIPSTIATLSSAGLTQVTHLFRDRMIGYTSVVPNPEVTHLPIVRELSRDADAYIGPEALSFEGLESYLTLRLCTEALRRTGPHVDGQRLGEAIENLGTLDLGGFRLTFGRERHHGSDYVEIGMRARDGRLLR